MDFVFWCIAICVGLVAFLFTMFALTQVITYAYLFARKRFDETQSQQEGEEE